MSETRVEPFLAAVGPGPAVSGFLHRPNQQTSAGLVLTHGAGSSCEAPLLVQIANAFTEQKITVLRCNLAFRQARRYGPPYPAQSALDREGLRKAVAALREIVGGRVFLGGHSYGGRQGTLLAAEWNGLVDGLLLFSYPLHPPGRPEQLRTAHFTKLSEPALFVHGSRDPFGSPEEMQAALRMIPGPTRLEVIDRAGHSLSAQAAPRAVAAFREFFCAGAAND